MNTLNGEIVLTLNNSLCESVLLCPFYPKKIKPFGYIELLQNKIFSKQSLTGASNSFRSGHLHI